MQIQPYSQVGISADCSQPSIFSGILIRSLSARIESRENREAVNSLKLVTSQALHRLNAAMGVFLLA